jgi:hypothetical protein
MTILSVDRPEPERRATAGAMPQARGKPVGHAETGWDIGRPSVETAREPIAAAD